MLMTSFMQCRTIYSHHNITHMRTHLMYLLHTYVAPSGLYAVPLPLTTSLYHVYNIKIVRVCATICLALYNLGTLSFQRRVYFTNNLFTSLSHFLYKNKDVHILYMWNNLPWNMSLCVIINVYYKSYTRTRFSASCAVLRVYNIVGSSKL